MNKSAKLTPKQERFCQEYMVDLNCTQAAIRAGYSEKTARSQGQRLLTNVDIEERVAELSEKVAQKVEITAEYVLSGLKEIAETPVDGNLMKMSDRSKALELLGKHIKLFTDKLESKQMGTVNLIQLRDLRANS